MLLMGDQLATNRYGRTLNMLERHRQIGVDLSLVSFFYGETYRQRGTEGDRDRAVSAYRESIEHGNAPPEAHRNLGYLLLKNGNRHGASDALRRYLELASDPSDRAMIESYLEDM
jgi:TPR repeat protein